MTKQKLNFGNPSVDKATEAELINVIRSGWLSQGPVTSQFETAWSNLFGYKWSVAVSNGTNADIAALMSLYDSGAKRGDEIIVPALAFAVVGNSVLAAGFVPKFVDVDRKTMNINPSLIEEQISPRTRAIMPVHTMGKPCKMDRIKDIANAHGLNIIEDCCEAHGARYKDRYVGTWGDLATFSFYAAHIVWSVEGGMVSSSIDSEREAVVRSVRNHGRGSLYFDHIRAGLNLRTTDLHATIGLNEIKKFRETFDKRKRNFNYLKDKLKDLKDVALFVEEDQDELLSPHAFSLILLDPKYDCKRLGRYLDDAGIEWKRNFGSMPTQHAGFKFLNYKLGQFPESEYIGDNGIHFGVHQNLTKEQLDYASDMLHEYFKKFG